MASGQIEIRGLADFRRALKAMDPDWPKALTKVHRAVATEAAGIARGIATGMGGVRAKAAGTIKGSGNQRSARIGPSGGGGIGNVAFWGAKKHTGWYGHSSYNDSQSAQHPPWVGSSWEVGNAGEGPYAINPAVATYEPRMEQRYFDMVLELAHDAFAG